MQQGTAFFLPLLKLFILSVENFWSSKVLDSSIMANLTPQFLQRFQIAKEDFKKSVCCQVDTLFDTFLNEIKTNFRFSVGDDGRAHYRSPMMNGSLHNSQSSHLHCHLGRPNHQQRSVANGNNPHFHHQNLSTSINKTHQRPMLGTHRITSGPRHLSYQPKTSVQSIISAHFNRDFKDVEEDFETYKEEDEEEDEEEEGSGLGFMLKGGSEGDEESEEDMSSENDMPNNRAEQVNGFRYFGNKRLKTEHCKKDVDAEEAETNGKEDKYKEEEENVENKDDPAGDEEDDDPSEEMVVHVAPDEAILNAGSRESPPTMLIPQNRMPSPLRVGDRLACPLTGCDRSYRQMKQYTSHMWTHRGIKPYRCTWVDGPNECNQCQYMSEHPRNVIQHVRLMHFGIPRTIKEQKALGIVDDRDPAAFMELRTDLDLG